MSDFSEISRLSRLTAILLALQTGKKQTARDLASRFEVSTRTIYRDVKALTEAGVPIYADEDKGYQLVEGYSLPPIMFSEEEAQALITAEKLIASSKDKSLILAHNQAIEKIKAVLQYSKKGTAELLSQRMVSIANLNRHTTSSNLLDIQSAITKGAILDLSYVAAEKKEPTLRKVRPLAIYHSKDNWVLIAWCMLRENYREFRLDRIRASHLTGETFDTDNFNLVTYFSEIREKNQTTPDIGLSQTTSTLAIINQKNSSMNKTTHESFHLVGVSTRTSNPDGQAAKDIPALWQKFMQEGISNKLSNKVSQEVICAYTEYDGDHDQPYTVIVGHKVSDIEAVPEGLKAITVPQGSYNKVVAKGDLTGKAVWEAWLGIWKAGFKRKYEVDFEVYGERAKNINDGEADIFVSIN